MSRVTKAIIAGLVTGILGMVLGVLPFGLDLDENVGLSLLYKLRGTRKVPSDVIVVSIDKASSEKLNIPADPEKWPRSLHARLTENLARKGASVVAFDLFFEEVRSKAEDDVFAAAIRNAQNVVLSERLELEDEEFTDRGEGMPTVSFRKEYLVTPIDPLAQSTLALAPFPLPKAVRVNQYWSFKKSAGDMPTLPVVVFQVYALDAYDDFIRLMKQVDPRLAEELPGNKDAIVETKGIDKLIRTLREAFQNNPALAEGMLEKIYATGAGPSRERERQILLSLIRMYQGPNSHHINFYGTPGTIPTACYHKALGDLEESTADHGHIDFKEKVVFVGLSERLRPVEKDGFPTVYSQPTGNDMSGVEIAATAFANLLEDMPVRPLSTKTQTAFFMIWGLLVGILCCSLPAVAAAVSMLGLGAVYLFTAQYQFTQTGMWYPLVFPLFFQIPFAFFGILICKYFVTDKQRVNIKRAFEYFVPSEVVDYTATDPDDLKKSDQIVYGICLYTDATQYTTLSESIELEELSPLMDKYYEAVFRPLKKYGGQVIDIKGDSILAVWKAKEPDAALRRQACLAALDIAKATSETLKIPTRIGLHYGRIYMGSKGFGDHFEYRPFGDTVNTASRIEGLNKYLGTQILASEEVLEQLDGFLTRDLGKIRPAGKSRSISVHELMSRIEECEEEQKRLFESFAKALKAFKSRLWNEAIEIFEESMHLFGQDGPSNFYLNKIEHYKGNPPEDTWDGVIDLDEK
jgi:adenylate cyclase